MARSRRVFGGSILFAVCVCASPGVAQESAADEAPPVVFVEQTPATPPPSPQARPPQPVPMPAGGIGGLVLYSDARGYYRVDPTWPMPLASLVEERNEQWHQARGRIGFHRMLPAVLGILGFLATTGLATYWSVQCDDEGDPFTPTDTDEQACSRETLTRRLGYPISALAVALSAVFIIKKILRKNRARDRVREMDLRLEQEFGASMAPSAGTGPATLAGATLRLRLRW